MNYNLSELAGKLIRYKMRVPVQQWAADNAPVIGYVEVGQQLKLYSILGIKNGRSRIYFEFIQPAGKSWYVPLTIGSIDLDHLRAQGVRNTEEVRRAQRPLLDRIIDNAGDIAETGAGITKVALVVGGAYFITRLFLKK